MTRLHSADALQTVPKETRATLANELRGLADTIERAKRTADVSIEFEQTVDEDVFRSDVPELAALALSLAPHDSTIELRIKWSRAAESARRRSRGRRARRKK